MTTTTYTTSKGDVVESPYTDTQACAVISEDANYSNFVASLIRAVERGYLSSKQRPWLHKLAVDKANSNRPNRGDEEAVDQELANLVAYMATVAEKKPRAKLVFGDIKLSVAGKASRNHGMVYVNVDGEYLGKIGNDGATRITDREVLDMLREFAQDPVTYAAQYGKETGNCCFCGKELTDERSTDVGYGPVCAGTWGLPWGN